MTVEELRKQLEHCAGGGIVKILGDDLRDIAEVWSDGEVAVISTIDLWAQHAERRTSETYQPRHR